MNLVGAIKHFNVGVCLRGLQITGGVKITGDLQKTRCLSRFCILLVGLWVIREGSLLDTCTKHEDKKKEKEVVVDVLKS